MSLVSASIPNLVNGVSQQAYTQRLASQGAEQVNFLSSIAEGLSRRPPTQHLAKIAEAPFGDAALHLINRDKTERYLVVIAAGALKVFDLEGLEKTVTAPEGLAYLASDSPSAAFRAVTVADYTFLVNREIAVAMTDDLTEVRPKEALVHVKQGNYGRGYRIEIDGVERAAFTTPNGGSAADADKIDTVHIAEQLRLGLQAAIDAGDLPGFIATRYQSALHISKEAGDFAVAVEDGYNGHAMSVAKDQLQRFSELPASGPNGFHVEIVGDQSSAFDDYYVTFEKSDDEDSAGVWREAVAQGAPYKIDPATMPHVLVREADGTFTFRRAEWEDRRVGDAESAPDPSFIGRRLNDVFFFRNRLGFLADENVILSRAGGFFNFWPKTVTAQVDSDPIDVAGSHNRVSILRHAAPYNQTLLLFADQTQFVIDGGETLTPASVSIRPTTEFLASPTVKPVGAGRHVYFVAEKGGYAGVREYYLQRGAVSASDAVENTKHAPSYIPEGAFALAAAGHDEMLALLTTGDPRSVYLYKYYWSREEKLQSSWSRWEFGENDRVLAAEFIDARMALVIERADGVYLEEIDLDPGAADPGFDFQLTMDRRITEADCAISVQGGETRLTLPYLEGGALWVAARESGAGLTAGQALSYARVGDGEIALSGDRSAAKLFIGRKYLSRYLFSPFILRENAPIGGAAALSEGRLQILYLALNYEESGGFVVQVTPKARESYRYAFTGKLLGADANRLGAAPLESGRFKLPIYARNTEVAIEILADGFTPARFISADWEGRWILRSQRMA